MNYRKHTTANVSNCNITVSDFLYLLIENQQYVGDARLASFTCMHIHIPNSQVVYILTTNWQSLTYEKFDHKAKTCSLELQHYITHCSTSYFM